jgi:putative ABC transport system permease protein
MRLSLRSNLVRHRTLTALTALAVCTGVALATALELASRGVEAQLEATATSLAGAAEIEITGGALGVPEAVLQEVLDVPGVAAAAPYVQTRLRIAQEPDPGSALYVIGVDLLLDEGVRSYSVERGDATVPDPLALIADPRSVLVTRSLAERLGIRVGGDLAAARGSERVALTVRGILEPGGVAEAFGGSVAVMDVYALQALLGRTGWLDRIDVVAAEGAAVPALMERIAEKVAGRASVRRSAARDEWVDYTLGTVRTIALSLALVGAMVAALLVFGATSLAVDRRAREFALLRAAGLEATRARRLVRTDALVVAAFGTALGLPLGFAIARIFLGVFSNLSAYLQDVTIERAHPTPLTVAVGLAVGLLVAHAGSFVPARRAGAASPMALLRGQEPAPSARGRLGGWATWAIAAITWVALAAHSFGLPPLLRIGALFGLGIVLLSAAIVRLLPGVLRSGRASLDHLIPRVGRLAGASLTSRSRSSSTTLAAVAGVIAGLTATLVLVESLATTFDDWIAGEYRGAVLVTAGSPFEGRDRDLVSHATIASIRTVSGVRSVLELFTGNIVYEGEEILLVGQSMDPLERYGRLPAIGIEPSELARALARGEIAVSDAFADHFGVGAGDEITLPTPRGPVTFRVAGEFRDYVGPAGSVQLDLGVLDRYWDREGAYMLAVWMDSPVESGIEGVQRTVGEGQDLFFIHGEALDHYAGDVLRRLAGILVQIAVVTSLLGGFAVANLLIGSVTERRRELFLLRSVGATNGQLMGLVLVDAALIALLGTAVGVAVGILCSYPMVTDVLREAFGWSVRFRIPIGDLAFLAVGVVLASLLAGFYPAWLAQRLPPRDVFAPE